MAVDLLVLAEPIDVVMFRDGRPFDAGADGLARSMTVPSPATFAGAVRSAIGESSAASAPMLAAWDDDSVDLYVPIPLDLVRDGAGPHLKRLDWRLESGETSDLSTHDDDRRRREVRGPGGSGEPIDGYISMTAMSQYLNGVHDDRVADEVRGGCEIVSRTERHVGLALADPGIDRTGFLYVAEFVRLHHAAGRRVGFAAFFHGLSIPSGTAGWIGRLGGENRQARFEVRAATSAHVPSRPKLQEPSMLVYLAGPAIFRYGWRPPLNSPIRLPVAVVGQPRPIAAGRLGRWSLAHAAPGGSVYRLDFRHLEEASAFASTFGLHSESLDVSEDGRVPGAPRPAWCLEQSHSDLRRHGFGLCLLGVVP